MSQPAIDSELERVCRVCTKAFVLGSRDECAKCRDERKRSAKVERLEGELSRADKKQGQRNSTIADSIVDTRQAIAELQTASDEMRAVSTGLLKHQRDAALVEPLARLKLVKRFVESVLKRHGVRSAKSDE